MRITSVFALAIVGTSSLFVSCTKDFSFHIPHKHEATIVTMQPGADEGQDCLVAYRETDNNLYATSNHSPTFDVTAIRWTYNADGAGEGTNRTYIKFTKLSELPSNAQILEAKLSLYGVESGVAAPLGNSYFPGSPYEPFGSNAAWLKRVTGDWDESSITWNTKPGTTDENEATVPASTAQWNSDAIDIDVTKMVKAMVNRSENYGFCLQLKDETIYKSILFGSSEHSNPNKRPKLVVKYASID